MQAILFDGIRQATVTFHPDNLVRLQAKYGDKLRVLGGSVPLQPAAPSLATVAYFAPDRAKLPTKPPRVKRIKAEKPEKFITVKPVKPAPKRSTPAQAEQYKPVINLTTGVFYHCLSAAAKAIGGTHHGISRVLHDGVNRKRHRGMMFRFATQAEITAKQMLHP